MPYVLSHGAGKTPIARQPEQVSRSLSHMRVRAALLTAVPALLALGAGGASTAIAKPPLEVGLVADATVLNDGTAGHSIYLGLLRAVRQLGVRGRVLTPSPKEGVSPSITYLARQGYDVVIVAAFEPDAVLHAARAYPGTTFVVPDQTIPGRPSNVRT